MTHTQRAAMEQALSALEIADNRDGVYSWRPEMAAFRAALAETAPVQEPVAWWKQYPDGSISVVESRTFLAEDAVAMGWRALGFTDVAPRAPQPAPVQSDGWLQDGSLLYRLTAEKRPQNRDEINVTMADGSRTAEARTRRAGELLDRIRQRPAPPADVPMLTDDELTAIYKQENGEDVGKAQPLTTQRIFKAMRAVANIRQIAGLT